MLSVLFKYLSVAIFPEIAQLDRGLLCTVVHKHELYTALVMLTRRIFVALSCPCAACMIATPFLFSLQPSLDLNLQGNVVTSDEPTH